MRDPSIATRYAQVLFEAAKADRAVEAIQERLATLAAVLEREPDLRQFLQNPDVEPEDQVRLLERAWSEACPPLLRAALRLIISFGRAEALADVIEAFDAAVDADAGRLRVTVRSARPLPEPVLARLRTTLARREGKTVDLSTQLDPALIGGIQVRLDHRVIDGSVARELANLRQRLTTTRVH